MTINHVRAELARWTPRAPRDQLDERIRVLLNRPEHMALRQPIATRKPWRMKGFFYAAVTALLVSAVGAWLLSRNAPTVVWAQVEEALRNGTANAQTVHLVQKWYVSNAQVNHGEIVTTGELWVQRPFHFREDADTYIAERQLDSYMPPHRISRYFNEYGEWSVDHTAKRYAVRGIDVEVIGRSPARTRDYLQFYANDVLERLELPQAGAGHVEGHYEGTEPSPAGPLRRYRFETAGGWTICWLDATNRLPVRIHWGPPGSTEPQHTYEAVFIDATIPDSTFVFVPPSDYADGQKIGLESEPSLIHPEKVVLEISATSVKFWNRSPGNTTGPSNTRPSIEVFFDPQMVGVVSLRGKEYDESAERAWSTTTHREPLGDQYFVVDKAAPAGSPRKVEVIRNTEFGRDRTVVVEIVTYCTDRIYAKIAYDADRDGEYDAWATIAEPPLPQQP
jgi:hypothetical protein